MRGAPALRLWACVALPVLAAGCASDDSKRLAMIEVSEDFRVQYERILSEHGTRVYRIRPDQALNALPGALGRLGFRVGNQALDLGFVSVVAPAPNPLNALEWQRAAEQDLPRMREIAAKHVGFIARFAKFEPEGLSVVINATAVEVPGGTEVSFTARMREIAPPRSGMPRREYLPPTAVRMGLDKIWAEFERELGGPRRRF